MGKQKQQVISRFFAPKPKSPKPQTTPPKITSTASFSPSKRRRITPKLSPHTHNPIPTHFFQNLPEPPPQSPSYPDPQHPIHTSLHHKFLQKLLEPSQTLPQPPPQSPSYTPLERQVLDLKSKYPDVLLMVEVGYKYRFFGQDAENAARVLGIYCHMDRNFLTASVPTFRLNVHVRRLVNAGFKVGVVRQTETAAIKAHGLNRGGPFERGLSALYTKATLEAAEGVGGGEEGYGSGSNYMICVVEKSVESSGCEVRIGVVAVEVSTGDVVYGEFDDNVTRAGLEAVVLSLAPTELLLGEPLSKETEKLLLAYAGPSSNARVERASRNCFSEGGALAEVMSLYENINENISTDDRVKEAEPETLDNNQLAIKDILTMPDFAVQALALLIRHLTQFGLERILCLGATFRPLSANVEMNLSANALQQLEILKNNSDGSESGSLLQCMNNTLTIFGSRLLKHWVSHPLCDRNMILARLDAVSEIANSMISSKSSLTIDVETHGRSFPQPDLSCLLSSVLTTLGRSLDIQRGITRIFHRTATSSEFVAVIEALLSAAKQLQQLHLEEEGKYDDAPRKSVDSILLRKLILTASSSSVIGNAAKLLSSLNKEAAHRGDLNLFNTSSGLFPEVGEAQMSVQATKDKLDSLIVSYRKLLRMSKLEYISIAGTTHLIEMPSDARVPTDWVKISSTKKTIRYHPPEVLTALDQLSLANEELAVVCRTSWNKFLIDFRRYYAEFQSTIQALAALDCLHSLAILSRYKNYVRPVFVNDSEPVQIHISSGRHPVMETILQENFVPNNTNLHRDGESCQIVTGPNMGGKSCYIRQVALIAIMAQVGSFVPASSVKLHVLDSVHTRMGSSDNIQQGRSTFLEELSEASNIIHNCTSQSLVIIDELGRGTSTHDGVAIAYATLQHLLEQKNSLVLFVTHYPKIVEIKNEFPGSVEAYHVSYLTSNNEIVMESSDEDVEMVNYSDVTYLYKLVPGVSERSFGFKVAQLAQLPDSCIRRAVVMASKLEADVSKREKGRLESLLEKRVTVNDKEQPCTSKDFDCCHVGRIKLEEFAYSFRELFNNIDSALEESNDLARSFQVLEHAKSIATKLNSWFET